MRWHLIIEDFGPELKYISREKTTSLPTLSLALKRVTIKRSSTSGYDDKNLPDNAYPIRYHDIAKAQETDAKLQQKIVSHKDYTLNTFFGGDKDHRLICQNNKICLSTSLQKKTMYWYHEMLCLTV